MGGASISYYKSPPILRKRMDSKNPNRVYFYTIQIYYDPNEKKNRQTTLDSLGGLSIEEYQANRVEIDEVLSKNQINKLKIKLKELRGNKPIIRRVRKGHNWYFYFIPSNAPNKITPTSERIGYTSNKLYCKHKESIDRMVDRCDKEGLLKVPNLLSKF